jgi:hypothetical protein
MIISRGWIPLMLAAISSWAFAAQDPSPPRVSSRYTFSWPVGPDAPAPRGGSTRGAAVVLDTAASPAWQALQEQGINTVERDRRAILAMAGNYRVSFDFLEVASFGGDGMRPRPYQSWGTERVFVDRDEPHFVSLVHILEMRIAGADGTAGDSIVTKHWRQDWRFEPEKVMEYRGGYRWEQRTLDAAERRGRWSQTVFQVDESPRYASTGRWEHNATFSTWISGDTARPLPRREWSVRKDYDVLRGTNRHTVLPTGWLQEENNLKNASGAAQPFVGREYGVARYERLKDADFAAAENYYQQTRTYWAEVMKVWSDIWKRTQVVQLTGNSDQTGAFGELFQQADDFATGKLRREDAASAIRSALAKQGAR